MVRTSRPMLALFACSLLATFASTVEAHCCHDDRFLGTSQQSEFRGGLHGMDRGLADDFEQRDPPSIGNGLGSGTGSLGSGGLGQMHGNSMGNYGAGSIGEPGPGGLGALRGDPVWTQTPRPR